MPRKRPTYDPVGHQDGVGFNWFGFFLAVLVISVVAASFALSEPEPWIAACAEARKAPTDANLYECLGW